MAARLKVFVTSDGLTDYVVAATSRPKALAAWGVRQDLFKEGLARESDDPKLRADAEKRPGEVLRRPAGSRATLARAKAPRKPKPKAPSKAVMKRVAMLEGRIKQLDAEAEALETRLREDIAALEAKAEARRAALAERRREASEELRKARRALEG